MSGDYISREAALAEACKECGIDFPCEPCEPQDCEIKARLQAIPAADVYPVRHGRWIVSATNLHFDSKCSACGETFYSPLRGAYIVHHAKYCPSCGAKMDGDRE